MITNLDWYKTHIPDILGKSDFFQYGFRLGVVSVQ